MSGSQYVMCNRKTDLSLLNAPSRLSEIMREFRIEIINCRRRGPREARVTHTYRWSISSDSLPFPCSLVGQTVSYRRVTAPYSLIFPCSLAAQTARATMKPEFCEQSCAHSDRREAPRKGKQPPLLLLVASSPPRSNIYAPSWSLSVRFAFFPIAPYFFCCSGRPFS